MLVGVFAAAIAWAIGHESVLWVLEVSLQSALQMGTLLVVRLCGYRLATRRQWERLTRLLQQLFVCSFAVGSYGDARAAWHHAPPGIRCLGRLLLDLLDAGWDRHADGTEDGGGRVLQVAA